MKIFIFLGGWRNSDLSRSVLNIRLNILKDEDNALC